MTNRLPELDTLRQEAKSLLRAVKAGEQTALDRLAPYFADPTQVSLQNAQLVLAREHGFRSWSKLKAHLTSEPDQRLLDESADSGQQLAAEIDPRFRDTTEYLRWLFDEQTPELEDGRIRILNVARLPRLRAKVAVRTLDPRINPVGACIGLNGERVQAVSEALDGERIDIFLWSDDRAQNVANALLPAKVERVSFDDALGDATVDVSNDQYDVARGKDGHNVKLASDLCRCRIELRTST